MDRLTIARPDDWHLHLRDGAALAAVVGHSARRFGRALVMPNLRPPVTTVAAALAYRDRILAACPPGSGFQPLMALYLTDRTPPAEVEAARASGVVVACKLYPAGATTNAEAGVTRVERVAPVLEAMEEADLPLAVHGEVTDPEVDLFDRERVFLDRVFLPLLERFPRLRVVLEHCSTADGVEVVRRARAGVAATVTAHHLLLDRNALFDRGARPHHYCLPVVKGREHRRALLEAVTSGDPRFFLGTDSAPHPRRAKESGCGPAGVFTAPLALELYAEAFAEAGALDRLEGFAALHGARFYHLPPGPGRVTLAREPWPVPASYPFGDDEVVPLRAGETATWRVLDEA